MDQQAPAEPFDIGDYMDTGSAEVPIRHPLTGARTSTVITLAGPEHPTSKRIAFDKQRRLRAGMQRTGKLQLGSPEEDEADELESLAARTLGWSNMIVKGQLVPFSRGAALEIYGDPQRRWLRDQVRAALDEREAFIGRSASN